MLTESQRRWGWCANNYKLHFFIWQMSKVLSYSSFFKDPCFQNLAHPTRHEALLSQQLCVFTDLPKSPESTFNIAESNFPCLHNLWIKGSWQKAFGGDPGERWIYRYLVKLRQRSVSRLPPTQLTLIFILWYLYLYSCIWWQVSKLQLWKKICGSVKNLFS